jgi:hypothetical protein
MLLTGLAFYIAVGQVNQLAKARFASRHDLRVKLFEDALSVAADKFRDRQRIARESVKEKRERGSQGPMPSKQEFGVSHQGAERLCAGWMKYLGASEVEVTQLTGDGGIDVVASSYIAQVKNYAGTVPINDVRALAGVMHTDGRKGLFFTSGGYSTGAVSFADDAGIALFIYSAEDGTLNGANAMAKQFVDTGL